MTNADEFEFIELVNVGDAAIDLTNVELVRRASGGVEFRFADADIQELWPGERVLVVEDVAAFAQRYGDGLPVAGAWLGGLSNRSETITLSVGGVSRELTYSDQWYAATDGNGRTLERIDAIVGALLDIH